MFDDLAVVDAEDVEYRLAAVAGCRRGVGLEGNQIALGENASDLGMQSGCGLDVTAYAADKSGCPIGGGGVVLDVDVAKVPVGGLLNLTAVERQFRRNP